MRIYGKMFVPLLVASLFFVTYPAHAQFDTGQSLSIIVSPQNPRPYDTVTITPDSNAIDLIASLVTVSVNGKVVETGTGAQSIPVTIGGPGETTKISVTAKIGGASYTSTVLLKPADVSLVIEPVSITHPFYLGGGLVAPSGRVRIIALPDLRTTPNVRLNPSTLIYTWKLGDQILKGDSGIGRSMLVATAPVRYRDAQVSVTVTNSDSTLVAQSATTISPVDPVSRVYHNDALMGPDFDHALSAFIMTTQEEAFRVVPYYFATLPSLSWAVNGQSASNDADVTVRTTGSGKGTATLSLTAIDSATRQSSSASLPITFGARKSVNIFGF